MLLHAPVYEGKMKVYLDRNPVAAGNRRIPVMRTR